jgi:hypothetical protein
MNLKYLSYEANKILVNINSDVETLQDVVRELHQIIIERDDEISYLESRIEKLEDEIGI